MKASGQESLEICWGERRSVAELLRTQRRVLRVEVRPSGEVVVLAPIGEEIQAIKSRVMRKSAWIFRELDRTDIQSAVTPARHFLSGETHLVLGKPYRLSIEQQDEPEVRLEGDRLYILTQMAEDKAECRRLLMQFMPLPQGAFFRSGWKKWRRRSFAKGSRGQL